MSQKPTTPQTGSNSMKIVSALLIGFLIGVAIYSASQNGFSFGTILPIVLILILIRGSRKSAS